MDRHKCKLCLRSFSNGRALGGHMRSHMMNLPLPVPPKPEEPPPPPPPLPTLHLQFSEDAESASFPSSPSSSEGEAEEKGLSYGLRENPKRSIRLVDPEFSFAVDAGSVVLQDRESETESSKNPTRRRSKRARKPAMDDHHHHHHHHYDLIKRFREKQEKLVKKMNTESWTEPEPVSSISGTTTEEDVAFCLMMLSRDNRANQRTEYGAEEEEDDDDDEEEEEEEEEESMEETDDSEELKFPKNRSRGSYKCETCNKVFRSYQALGGHRASHKKIKVSVNPETMAEQENAATTIGASMAERKIHECPVCFRVFSSGQALGGHKRSHVTGLTSANPIPSKIPAKKFGESLIDLNLPAPFEEDDVSQIELSAVSDADFVNAIRQ